MSAKLYVIIGSVKFLCVNYVRNHDYEHKLVNQIELKSSKLNI